MDPTLYQLQDLVNAVHALQEELEIADDIINSLIEDLDIEETLEKELFEEKKKWIQGAIKHSGALRKSLKTKEGKNIPISKLEKAAKKGGKLGKRARLALTLRKLNKK